MKKTLSAFFLFFSIFLTAQTTFEKGYLIDNNDVKTICYIKNIDWMNNPVDFEYKSDPSSTQILKSNISESKEFGIDNICKYVRYSVNIERSDINISNLQTSKMPQFKLETLFLKALITGPSNLYIYKNYNITKYFYETASVPLEQLIYIKYLDDDNIKENNQFRQQLLNHVRCDNSSESDFNALDYRKNELIRIFNKYNECHKQETSQMTNYDEKVKHKSFALKVAPGIYTAKLSVSDPGQYYNVNTEFKKTVFKIAFEAEYILPFNKGNWSIFVNPGYHTFSATNNFTRNNGFGAIGKDIQYTANAKYASIELPFGFRHYFYLNPSSKIFINAMYAFNLSVSDSKIDFKNNTNGYSGTATYDLDSRNNIAIGAGYNYKRFSIELRLNTPRQLTDMASWAIKYNTSGIVVGYNIF